MTWYAECWRRFKLNGWFKFAGTTFFVSLFFYLYFLVMRTPATGAKLMPLTALDHWISFWPPAFYAYASLWFYTALVPALLTSIRSVFVYGWGIGALCIASLIIFAAFPTAVPFSGAELSQDATTAFLRKIDLAGNACPSLHVACSLFTAFALRRVFLEIGVPGWVHWTSYVWCSLIVYSTMAIKQHVVLDVLAGAAMAALFAVMYPGYERWFLTKLGEK